MVLGNPVVRGDVCVDAGDKSSNSRVWNRLANEIDFILSNHVNGKFLFISCLIR